LLLEIKALNKVFLSLIILLTASPALAQELPSWLEKQVRSGYLSQQEAVVIWKGSSNTPQPSIPIQEVNIDQKKVTQEISSGFSEVKNTMSSSCTDAILSDIKARFPYDTIVDGPRWGLQKNTQTLSVIEGNLQNLRGGDSDSFNGRFLNAIIESAPFTRYQCGHPSGTLTISARNNPNSIGQWSLVIELLNSITSNQVTCIAKLERSSSDEHITHIGGSWGKITREEAIRRIDSKQDEFYTQANNKRAVISVVRESGRDPYLRTDADDSVSNNLLDLGKC
jgi:Protein of unknown function (DUF3892)